MNADQQEYKKAAELALASDESNSNGYQTLASIGAIFLSEFKQAQLDRRQIEMRWLMDLRQYKGIYDPAVIERIGSKRSKSFVRKSRVKVKTLDARMMDLLFPSGSTRNWKLEPTPEPNIAPEQRALIIKQLKAAKVPASKEALDQAIMLFATEAAKGMTKAIDDQLADTKYRDIARKVVHSGNLYGTGVLKAPLVERKVRMRFVSEGGKWSIKSESYVAPFLEYIPLWRFYPDMASTELANCRYVYELHTMTKTAIAELADRKSFNSDAVKNYILSHPNGETAVNHYDTEIRSIGERLETSTTTTGLYDVIERWGWIDATTLEGCGINVPEERRHESFFANVWMLPNGEVIRASLQPINGVTWPYHLYYFDKDETSIFAEGVCTIMRDDQEMINASTRMILDNGALTSGPQFEIDVRQMVTTEGIDESYPFKCWLKTGENANANPAVRVLDIPSRINELAGIRSMFDANADEILALPKFMNGENATQGAAGTASGMSMLMGAANINVKDLISSYDDGVTTSFITSLFRWNMQFNDNAEIKGDFSVTATGASSLVAKEIRNQQLSQFGATLQPEERQFVKWDKVVQAKSDSLDLNDIIKTDEEVQAEQNSPQAQMGMQQQQLAMAQLQAMVAKLQAEAEKLRADTMETKVAAAYSAMQAAGVAVTNAHIAPAGDQILQSAGWQDAPAPQVATDPNAQPIQPEQGPEQGMQQGMQAGIETPELGA